jgi:DNA-binding transcriptional LysR family regulator
MDLEHWRTFEVAARLSHFGKAADALDISQPLLSRRIAALEQYYDVVLFDRVGRSVTLNASGEALRGYALQLLATAEQAQREMDERAGRRQPRIVLGFNQPLGLRVVPTLLRAFREKHPEPTFVLEHGSRNALLERLRAGDVDVCLSTGPDPGSPFSWTPLWREELYVHVPLRHRFAARRSVSLRELEKEPLVAHQAGSAMRETIDGLLRSAGVTPAIVAEGETLLTLQGMVGTRQGIMIGPRIERMRNATVAIPISEPNDGITVGMLWLRARHPKHAVETFRAFAIRTLVRPGDVAVLTECEA